MRKWNMVCRNDDKDFNIPHQRIVNSLKDLNQIFF